MMSDSPRTDAFYANRFKAPDAIDFARQLERELAAAQKVCDSLMDAGCNKIMAMSDEQIKALCRLEGHDPDDEAKLTKQVLEIVILKHQLAERDQRIKELEKQLFDKEHPF